MKDHTGKKREKQNNNDDEVSIDNDFEKNEQIKYAKNPNYIKMPDKSNYRMRAHCNPLSEVSMNYPQCPSQVNWSLNYGLAIGNDQVLNRKIYDNTKIYPIDFKQTTNVVIPEATNSILDTIKVNILDIGCGYGGLLFNMSPILNKNDLALGLEIRDKVSNYVGERIKAIRSNSNGDECSNISIIKTNAMKVILNYFYKSQIDRMFFCFADPHFKRYTQRRRIINNYLLQDYGYLLKENGIIYSITDVEDLHNWHVKTLDKSPLYKRIPQDELESDPYLECMKNTDEARKVKRDGKQMFYGAWRRVRTNINSFKSLLEVLSKQEQQDENEDEEN